MMYPGCCLATSAPRASYCSHVVGTVYPNFFMSDVLYQTRFCPMSLRRQYTVPPTVHGASALGAKLSRVDCGTSPWFSGAVQSVAPVVLQAASLYSSLKTTSGQPLPARLYSSILVCR